MNCPYCGRDELVDLMVMERLRPVAHFCHGCGRRIPVVEFRRHEYSPPLRYAVFTEELKASIWSENEDFGPPTIMPIKFGSIYCGPPADQPHIPTPDEILDAAEGLGNPWRDA